MDVVLVDGGISFIPGPRAVCVGGVLYTRGWGRWGFRIGRRGRGAAIPRLFLVLTFPDRIFKAWAGMGGGWLVFIRVDGGNHLRIMSPRRFKKKFVKRIVEKRVAKAIEEYEKTKADSNNTGGSGSANTGGILTEGVVGLKRWFKKIEQVFEICKCAEDDKVKFAVCTFEGRALTWWNRNVQTLGLANANQIPWSNVKAMMTTEYCPTIKINGGARALDFDLKGDDIEDTTIASTNCFDVSALRIGDSNKRKWEDQQGNNHHQQQNRRQEAAKVYVAAPAKGRGYAGNLPWCNRCKAHHQPGPCPPRCGTCHKLGHQEGDCRTRIPVARDNSLQNVTCFGCGNHGHYRSDCPELKNRN
ncbi:putative reverse transcriptase domain-containing protein [Tanacetum coccineum]